MTRDARGNDHGADGRFTARPRGEADVDLSQSGAPGPWPQGREQINDLLDLQHLERIQVDERFVETQLQDAEDTLQTVEHIRNMNPRLAYAALYDAARFSMEAALAKQGLRPTAKGGHTVVIDALSAQLGRAGAALKPMHRIRKRRHDAEYPYPDTPLITISDVDDDLPKVREVVTTMRKFVSMIGEF